MTFIEESLKAIPNAYNLYLGAGTSMKSQRFISFVQKAFKTEREHYFLDELSHMLVDLARSRSMIVRSNAEVILFSEDLEMLLGAKVILISHLPWLLTRLLIPVEIQDNSRDSQWYKEIRYKPLFLVRDQLEYQTMRKRDRFIDASPHPTKFFLSTDAVNYIHTHFPAHKNNFMYSMKDLKSLMTQQLIADNLVLANQPHFALLTGHSLERILTTPVIHSSQLEYFLAKIIIGMPSNVLFMEEIPMAGFEIYMAWNPPLCCLHHPNASRSKAPKRRLKSTAADNGRNNGSSHFLPPASEPAQG